MTRKTNRKPCNIALGRFQPFTKGHLQMLQDGYDKNGYPAVVFMIANKKFDEKHPFSDDLIAKEMTIVKKNYKFIADIIPADSADIVKIGNKLSELGYEAHLWLCGDDREAQFKRQAENPKYQGLGGFPADFTTYTGTGRVDGVSGTAVRTALRNDDKDTFKKLIPKGVDVMFDDFKYAINKINERWHMKSLSEYICEALVNKPTKKTKTAVKPKDKNELRQVIKDAIVKEGNDCDLNFIDVSEITDMVDLFCVGARSFNGDISEWDVSNVNNMSGMFQNTVFNGDISNWDVSNVKNMSDMFNHSKFDGDISNWDVSNVENMGGMFYAVDFTGDISNWDVSNVMNMEDMFNHSKFNGDISNWNVSNVTDMYRMFRRSHFNWDISNWNVSNVTDMEEMFQSSWFDGDISKWDVSNVIHMDRMFEKSSFSGDISKWNMSNVKYPTDMFVGCPLEDIYGETPEIKNKHLVKHEDTTL